MSAGEAQERLRKPLPNPPANFSEPDLPGTSSGLHARQVSAGGHAPARGARFNGAAINVFLDDEYLTVAEVARRLSVSEKTVRRRTKDGTWEKGVVWFAPPGAHPRLSWKAVVAWLRSEN